MAQDNKVVGQFNLDGIAPAQRGIPQIEVTFDVDANGILTVSAKDKATGKEQHITVDNKNSLSQDEIDRIKKDAEEHKEEDLKKENEFKRINEAESYMYAIKNSLKDDKFKDKFNEDDKKKIEDLCNNLDTVIKEKNIDKIESAKKELEDVYNPIISKIYAESNPQGTGTQNSNPFDSNPFGGQDMFNKMQ